MDPRERSKLIFDDLVRLSGAPPPRLRLWDGTTHGPEDAPSTLVLRHPGAFRSMLLPPTDLSAGEAYVFDDVDIEGDVFALLHFAGELDATPRRAIPALRALARARRLPDERRRPEGTKRRFAGALHSRRRDRETVRFHYDTGNGFFETFLDDRMVYSCAAFLDPDEDLGAAQERKLDLVCRKLGLDRGMTLLDVGCGWGALVIHAAVRYGARATGITLSSEQADYARKRAAAEGVGHLVEIHERDYREMTGSFDAIASVGMVEHVGTRRLPTYFEKLTTLLAPGGVILNHGITTRSRDHTIDRGASFIGNYVFPDGDLRPLEEIVEVAERAGLEVRDVEALRMSYAQTLRRWVANLEANAETARAIAGEQVYRIWRAYMAGSAVAFELGAISVYQVLLADPARPWSYGRARLLARDDADQSEPASSVTA